MLIEVIKNQSDVIRRGELERSQREAAAMVENSSMSRDLEMYQHVASEKNDQVAAAFTILDNLSSAIVTVYNQIAKYLDNSEYVPPEYQVTPDVLVYWFENYIGKQLLHKVNERIVGWTAEYTAINDEYRKAMDENVKLKETMAQNANRSVPQDELLHAFEKEPSVFQQVLSEIYKKTNDHVLKQTLTAAYFATAVERLSAYKSATDRDLKLYELVEFKVLKDHVTRVTEDDVIERSLYPANLGEGRFFLDYFIGQLGNALVENFVHNLDLKRINVLAFRLFEHFYVPIMNKKHFSRSIEGPFANFKMIYNG